MRRTLSIMLMWAAAAAAVSAQTPSGAPGTGQSGGDAVRQAALVAARDSAPRRPAEAGEAATRPLLRGRQAADPNTLRLGVDQAVRMALERNVDLAAARLDPQIGETQVAAAAGAFAPVFNTTAQQNRQVDPPASLFAPFATRSDAFTSQLGLRQSLPWRGTSYSVSWTAVHTSSNSILNSFDPILQSGLSLQLSQPLARGFAIDPARRQLEASRIDRDISVARLRESVVHTTAQVKSAYWNLVSAIDTVEARRQALGLAQELTRVNKVKVDVGQSPPLDLVSARAEVAANQEQLIIAETRVKEVEDQLRTLIFDTSEPDVWRLKIVPAELPPVAVTTLDLDAAVTNALKGRADLDQARKDIEQAQVGVKFAHNERLPDVRLIASYASNGLGGTQVLRQSAFPFAVLGPGPASGFGSVLNQVFTGRYSTWNAGVSVNYPIGQTTEIANDARARLEQRRSEERLKSAESRAIQQVRDAWWQVEMNARRIDTTRAARELAEQRLSDEQKRFQVGVSTSFLVIQAQRDLAQAKTGELAAILAYDLALVDFEALQQAGPADTTSPAIAAAAAPASSSR